MPEALCISDIWNYLSIMSAREGKLDVPALQHHCIKVAGDYLLPSPALYIAMSTGNFEVLSYEPGRIVIRKEREGPSPFNHPHVRLYHEYIKSIWRPPRVLVNVFMPCTQRKPYQRTVTHKMMLHYIDELRRRGIEATLYSISEPMLVVPYRLEKYYPLSNYEFPPKLMESWEKKLMIMKLRDLLPRFLRTALLNVFVLPRHHASIVLAALLNNGCDVGCHDRRGNDYGIGDSDDTVEMGEATLLVRYGRLAFKSLRKAYLLILEYFRR